MNGLFQDLRRLLKPLNTLSNSNLTRDNYVRLCQPSQLTRITLFPSVKSINNFRDWRAFFRHSLQPQFVKRFGQQHKIRLPSISTKLSSKSLRNGKNFFAKSFKFLHHLTLSLWVIRRWPNILISCCKLAQSYQSNQRTTSIHVTSMLAKDCHWSIIC